MTRAQVAVGTALLACFGVLVLKVTGWDDLDENIDGTTIGLLVLALGLLFTVAFPQAARDLLGRISSIKLPGGVEIALGAVNRAERIQADTPQSTDRVEVDPRPRSGNPRVEFNAVRGKLEERLRFVRDAIFDLPKGPGHQRTVARIESEDLLRPDELGLVMDILGRVEDQIEKLPAQLRNEFLDASWRFAWRFGSLVFERLVRERLTEAGWLLLDFEQSSGHRPDFLAYRDEVWLLLAARVDPGRAGPTVRRLARHPAPFGAVRVVVIPDSRKFEPDEQVAEVDVLPLNALIEREWP